MTPSTPKPATTAEALLPCPFCGEQNELYRATRTHRGGEVPYAIDCLGCGFDFVPRAGSDVVAMWNRRHKTPELSGFIIVGEQAAKQLKAQGFTRYVIDMFPEKTAVEALESRLRVAEGSAEEGAKAKETADNFQIFDGGVGLSGYFTPTDLRNLAAYAESHAPKTPEAGA